MPLNEAEMLDAIIGDNAKERKAFLAEFRRTVVAVAKDATRVHVRLDRLGAIVAQHERIGYILQFLHIALNNVVSSTGLLVEGYPLPSGHLMRQYDEATAMILLFLDPKSGVLDNYKRKRARYRVDGALRQVDEQHGVADRLRLLLGLDRTRWRAFMNVSRFYHGFSHAGALATIFHFPLDKPGRVIIGAHYDPAKRNATRLELRRRRTALKSLDTLVRILFHVLPRAPRKRPTKTPARRSKLIDTPPPRIGLAAIRAKAMPQGSPSHRSE